MAQSIPTGSISVFQQTAAPTNWTKITTYNNYTLRLVNGSVTTGGSVAFPSVFTSFPVSGTSTAVTGITSGATTLTVPTISAHQHASAQRNTGPSVITGSRPAINPLGVTVATYPASGTIGGGTTGAMDVAGGGSHSHTFTGSTGSLTGSAVPFAIAYVDVILASRN
jgi:hypothetical protein